MARLPHYNLGSGTGTASGAGQHPVVTDGEGRDRQILVVGDGFEAEITAGFLDQTGLDPVLASTTGDSTQPRIVPIWEPGLILLERIGLRRPIERLGTPLTELDCLTAGQSWTTDGECRAPLVVIRREKLTELVHQHLHDRIRKAERAVSTVETTGTGVRATFEQGIDELFDTVVTTDESLVTATVTDTQTTVHTWAFDWPAAVAPPGAPTEAWARTRAVFSTPTPDGTRVQLVSTAETPAVAVSIAELEAQFGQLFAPLEDPLSALDQHSVQYSRVDPVEPASLCLDRISLVGPAARPSIPGGCLAPALAIEDAWVLADALAYGPADVDEALATYESRRHRRASQVLGHDTPGCTVATDLSPLLRLVNDSRRLAFTHVFDRQALDVARAVPECL